MIGAELRAVSVMHDDACLQWDQYVHTCDSREQAGGRWRIITQYKHEKIEDGNKTDKEAKIGEHRSKTYHGINDVVSEQKEKPTSATREPRGGKRTTSECQAGIEKVNRQCGRSRKRSKDLNR